MKRLFAIAATFALAACVHSPPPPICADAEKVWIEPELVAVPVPGSRRIGGMMAPREHWRWTRGRFECPLT